jgi:uncharacterized protein
MSRGETPLHQAVIDNNLPLVKKLALSPHNLQRANHLGFTPLHYARYLNRQEILSVIDPYSHKIRIGNLIDDQVTELRIEEFEQVAGIRYLPSLHFPSLPALLRHHKKFQKKKRAFDLENQWLATFYKPELIQRSMAPVVIKWIDEEIGYGLFASADIPRSTFIGEYTGRVELSPPFTSRSHDYAFQYPGRTWCGVAHMVQAAKAGNEMRFINHSQGPNVEAVGLYCEGVVRIAIHSIGFIPKGDQLTLCYGERYWLAKRRRGEREIDLVESFTKATET